MRSETTLRILGETLDEVKEEVRRVTNLKIEKMNTVEITELIGKTLSKIENNDNEELIFHCETGEKYKLYHSQDCCESVSIEDINGDLDDLIGAPILLAEEVNNEEFQKNFEESFKLEEGKEDYEWNYKNEDGNSKPESCTWTFYKLATIKGYVDIRWYGSSNGYYSESVDVLKADENGNFSRW